MANHRLHPTLADYIAIAINPVLVMGLVGSLIYFLLEVLYQGSYPDRLQFCLSMFILGTVLISRIAMEDGYEHAAPFGVGLAVVVALALNKFVDYGSGSLASFGWAINWGLMALTWWCAHQLTWDCTVIDDTEEPESQGLLETVGIDKATGQPTVAAEPVEQDAPTDSNHRRGRVLAGWEQVLNRKGRPHAPGVWVVYFSLASLPIFGIGQLVIPESNTPSRRYVFGLLCVYVACGLGLLLTTSFLALRRYLRRRRLEMPPIMAGTWLVTGSIMIVALLLLVAMLPRPNPEYAISELPLKFSSAEHGSSKLAVGEEGTDDEQADSGSGVDHSRDPGNQDPQGSGGKQPSPDGQNSAASGGKGESPGSGGEGSEKAGQSPGGKAGDKAQQGQSKQAQSQQTQPEQDQSQGKNEPQQQQPAQQSQSGQKQNTAKQAGAQPSQQNDNTKPGEKEANQNEAKQSPTRPQQSESGGSTPALPDIGSAIGGLLAVTFKWVFYGILIGAVVYFGWQSREKLLAIVRDWIERWRKFWDELWGRSKTADDGTPLPTAAQIRRQQPFSDFVDPFAAGSARQYAPAELVKYTFAALEAWGRDHGSGRPPDATPHEFARQVGSQFQPVAAGARSLADLYCRALYSLGDLPPDGLDSVRRLWQLMRSIDAQLVANTARE